MSRAPASARRQVDWSLLVLTLGKDAARLLGPEPPSGRVPRARLEQVYNGLPEGRDRERLSRFIESRSAEGGAPVASAHPQLKVATKAPPIAPPRRRKPKVRASDDPQAQLRSMAEELIALRAQVKALTPPPPPSAEAVIATELAALKESLGQLGTPQTFRADRVWDWRQQIVYNRAAEARTELSAEVVAIDAGLREALQPPAQLNLRAWIREATRTLARHRMVAEDAESSARFCSSIVSPDFYSQVHAAQLKYAGLVQHLERRLAEVQVVVDALPFGRPVRKDEVTPRPQKEAIDRTLAEFIAALAQEPKKIIVDKVVPLMPITGSIQALLDWRGPAIEAARELRGQLQLGRAFRGASSFQYPTELLEAREELERIIAVVERAIEAAGVAV